jgi:hypothetical protein
MLSIFDQRMQDATHQVGPRGSLYFGITLGKVVSTNDPQQMGRLYVHCPELGDPPDLNPEDFETLPLCSYLSPLGGSTGSRFTRGPNDDSSPGPLTYGIWALPKEGAIVAVVCIDGNPSQRMWIGCLYDHMVVNTLPSGRYIIGQSGNQPDGPLTATEQPIQPQYDNYTQAFQSRVGNFEWRTRGADYQAAAVVESQIDNSVSEKQDDQDVVLQQEDGSTVRITQGYAETRIASKTSSPDSSVYSWTTPGFHSISMDDRVENSRMRIKTTAGHQIILDDTNERIYISTAKGNNWIEIDEDGTIDIFSTEKISATARHINLTAEETIRLYGKKGVHIRSDTDVRISAKNIHENASAEIRQTAGRIDLNSPSKVAETSFFPNRLPGHEPWARTGTKSDTTTEPKYPYNDPRVGREHKKRGKYWRR